jgi:tetratricopeptide (TPR) repeat protein
MILAVGPGTPAYEIYHSYNSDSSGGSHDSEESFEEHDDNNESDDEETNIANNHQSSGTSRLERGNGSANNNEHVCNQNCFQVSEEYVPSMKHDGCINTSTWLDTGWRVSRARTEDSFLNSIIVSDSYSSNSKFHSIHSLETEECPTQLITSGDDTSVKIWDVEMSMGRASPIPSSCTQCPFGYTEIKEKLESSNIVKSWKSRYQSTDRIPGLVKLMSTIETNHRANVFHAIPVGASRKGKILTCAADGTVRMSDVDHQSPPGNYNPSSQIVAQISESISRICYSIHMLDQNNGLLCYESGLKLFDLRMSAYSQTSERLLAIDGCKSCAVYSTSSEDSSYIFANHKDEVYLYDLRLMPGQPQNIVQRYRAYEMDPGAFVSGIDVSKDRKELLVSYENDHIYTFPVFRSVLTSPDIDEILSFEEQNKRSESNCNRDFASYGGHLNRYTFLKSAKYAGPNDEYICTGSDSGHAFIYDKKSSAVVSLLKADTSICNGIVPHPTLPFFITYGINSSAKLWRASLPVDDDVDDSIVGRRFKHKQKKYLASPLAKEWDEVQVILSYQNMFPEEVILDPIDQQADFEDLSEMFFRTFLSEHRFQCTNNTIMNDLMNLPEVLAKNMFEVLNPMYGIEELPVVCDIRDVRRRISIIRLNHQAQELGLYLDSSEKQPWKLIEIQSQHNTNVQLSNADTIPNFASDWFPFDSRLAKKSLKGGCNFHKKTYKEFYELCYKRKEVTEEVADVDDDLDDNDHDECDNDCEIRKSKALDLLYDTIKQLKEDGNRACKDDNINLAASYYDKALRYCSIIYMNHKFNNIVLQNDLGFAMAQKCACIKEWSPLFKTFISILLNLAMVNLKPEIHDPKTASKQLKIVLRCLSPFVNQSRMITTDERPCNLSNPSEEIYKEAKAFEAKAYFRLGTAMMELKDFSLAKKYYEESLESQKAIHPDSPPDKHILRKLAAAKNQLEKKRRHNKKRMRYFFE